MSLEANKALVRRYYDEVINQQKLDAIDELMASDFVHDGARRGTAGQREAVSALLAAFSGLQVTIDLMLAEGDKVVARQTWRGTQHGTFLGAPPAGKQVTFSATATLRVQDGRIAEAWENEDDMGVLRQIGAVSR